MIVQWLDPDNIYDDIDYINKYGILLGWPLSFMVPMVRWFLTLLLGIPAIAVAIVGSLFLAVLVVVVFIMVLIGRLGRTWKPDPNRPQHGMFPQQNAKPWN